MDVIVFGAIKSPRMPCGGGCREAMGKMMVTKTFTDGYYDGWKSVLGKRAPVPTLPSCVVPTGRIDYAYGYDKGQEAALTRNTPRNYY
jgi:hypothetical protein